MLRQLLVALVLVLGLVCFYGCEQDGVNGTNGDEMTAPSDTPTGQDGTMDDGTTGDGVTTTPEDTGTTTDEFGLDRGVQQDQTQTDQSDMSTQDTQMTDPNQAQ